MAEPGDRVLNPQPWGSWFEYALPDLTYAIDSRIEFFPPSVWDEYGAVTSGVDGWERILRGWAPTIIVVSNDETAFARRLRSIGWAEVFRDETGAALRRGP